MEIVGGITGAGLAVLILSALIVYRSWKYEQELDSLIWRLDFRDIKLNEDFFSNEQKANRVSVIFF